MAEIERNDYIAWVIDRKNARIAELENEIRAMHEADDAYGMGFYNEPSWLVHYRGLREMIGMPNRSL